MSESSFPVEASPVSAAPFTVGGALSETFRLWSDNLAIFSLLGLPSFLYSFLGPDPLAFSRAERQGQGGGLGYILGATLVGMLVQALYPLFVAKAASGEKPTLADAQPVFARLLPFVFTLLITYILIGLGFLCLIVPGILLALRWGLVAPVAILEPSMSPRARSRDLLRDHVGTFFLFGLVIVVVFAVTYAIAFAARAALGPLAGQVVVNGVNCLVASPIYSIGLTVVYLQLKRLKEGGDTAQLAKVFQ